MEGLNFSFAKKQKLQVSGEVESTYEFDYAYIMRGIEMFKMSKEKLNALIEK